MPLPNVPDWTDKEKLAGEKELLGFWVILLYRPICLNSNFRCKRLIAIRVWLGRNGALDRAMDRAGALGELFKRKPGETAVRLRLKAPRDFSLLLDVAAKVRPEWEFKAAVEAICGPECLERVAG